MYTGVDLVEIGRWQQLLTRYPSQAEKLFTAEEIEHCEKRGKKKAESYAGLWAAREAASKALGTGFSGASFQDAHVTWGSYGEPILHLQGKFLERAEALGIKEWSLSISHESTMAIAFVVMQ